MKLFTFLFGEISNPADYPELGTLVPVVDGAALYHYGFPEGSHDAQVKHIRDVSTHLLITLADRSHAHLTIWLEGDIKQHAIEVILGDEARCTILTINAASPSATVAITQRGSLGAGSVLRWQNVTLGGAHVTHDLVSMVNGADSESAVDWMFYAKGTEKQKLTVRNIFNGINGSGEILMRGIAEQKGHTICNGLIDIGLHGGGTNTYLTQQMLMLDPTSKVDAIPSLEIKTNDVKASHSATVARVTEEDLFYFGARGIAPAEARRMFVLGFLGDITGRIESAEQRDAIIEIIESKYARSAEPHA